MRTLLPGVSLIDCPDAGIVRRVASALSERLPASEIRWGAVTVLVEHDCSHEELADALQALPVARGVGVDRPTVEIPVTYSGDDLADIAEATGLSISEVIALHSGGEYEVGFIGFAAGFGYLTGLDPRLHMPRRPSPRPHVAAGSVAIAGEYTGVYTRTTPGGWSIVGHTDMSLWLPDSDPPAVFAPGGRVRFVPR